MASSCFQVVGCTGDNSPAHPGSLLTGGTQVFRAPFFLPLFCVFIHGDLLQQTHLPSLDFLAQALLLLDCRHSGSAVPGAASPIRRLSEGAINNGWREVVLFHTCRFHPGSRSALNRVHYFFFFSRSRIFDFQFVQGAPSNLVHTFSKGA